MRRGSWGISIQTAIFVIFLTFVADAAPDDVQSRNKANAALELSRSQLSAGKYPEAIAKSTEAAQLFHALQNTEQEGAALTISGLGSMYAGNYGDAFRDMTAALQIAHAAHDSKQEITRRNNIGTIFYFQGRYADALAEFQLAMKLVEASRGADWLPSRLQLTTANIAIIYQTLGQYDRALDMYSGLRASSDGLPPQERAQLLTNIGALYRRLGDPIKALEVYTEARNLYAQRTLVTGQIKLLNNIGIAQAHDLNQPVLALKAFTEAIQLARASSDKLGTLQALLYHGQTSYILNNPKVAAADFNEAAALATALKAPEERWKALLGLARIAADNGDAAREVALLREATTLIESLRAGGPSALLAGFFGDKREVYDRLIERLAASLAATSGADPAEVFRLMELVRARTLQDARKPGPRERTLAEIQRQLPADTILLEHWLGNQAIATIWITPTATGLTFHRTEAGLRSRFAAVNSVLSNPENTAWRPAVDGLANSLLDGITEPLRKAHSIIVVPDRETALIPFEVLPLAPGSKQRMIERYSISYLPSANLLDATLQNRATIPFWNRTLLAVGDPAPNGTPSAPSLSPARNNRRLPAAAAEVRDIGSVVRGRTAIYTGLDAKKENLKRGFEAGFPVVHLATHAFSNQEDPARSYVLLAGANPSQAYDYLFLNEIRTLDLHNVALMTLSACDTEHGRVVDGEGVASLGRSLLGAGAHTVITSLWEADDRESAALMGRFYRELASGTPAAEALRQAKVASSKSGTAHPFYWAGFVLNGAPSTTLPLVISWVYPTAGVLAAFGIVLLWKRKS